MHIPRELLLAILALLASPSLQGPSPPGRDLGNSNFLDLLRGGSSTGSAAPAAGGSPNNPPAQQSSPSPQSPQQSQPAQQSPPPQSPQQSQPSRIPYCDEVPASQGGTQGSAPASAGSGAAATPNSNAGGAPSAGTPSAATGSSPSSAGSSSTGASPTGPSSAGGSSPSSGGGGDKAPTYEQFCAAVNGYSKTSAGGQPPKPSQAIYDAFVKNVSSTLSLKEQAMFLANSIWETGGLQYMKEIACSNGSCQYGKYYGRGFIQLTWDYNYREASKDIYGDDTLVNNPDLAAEPEGAWKTALWFWNKKVAPVLKQHNAVDTFKLGYSIKVINGGLECPANQKAQNRMAIYNEILAQWNIDKNKPGKMDGC